MTRGTLSLSRGAHHGAAVEGAELAVLAEGERDAPGEHDNYAGAHGGGEVRVDMRHTYFGQQGGGGGKGGGEQRPSYPVHVSMLVW